MAANLTGSQGDINGSVTTEHGFSIVASSFGDNNRFEYNVKINSSQTVQVKDSVKYRFHGVPAENHDFVDRPEILTSMEVALSSPSKGCRILALQGLGGMGKTQLMLQYCYLHRSAYEYIFWLEVDSWNTAINSFRNLAINLGLDEESTKRNDSENKVVDWVRSWFQMTTKWLLLLNNADDTMSTDVFKLLPRIGGDIILTTREPVPSSIATVIPVHKMKEEEALLLLFGVPSMNLIEEKSPKLKLAREIIIELDFMPLAIDLARAYLENTLTSFGEYLNMFKDMNERAELLGYRNNNNLRQYKHTIATVWQLSLERVRALNPIAMQILLACTFLQPENIPVCLFKNQYSILELVLPFSGSSTSRYDRKQSWKVIREAVAVLVKFSFVTRTCLETEDSEENPANDVLTIHRLVQKVIYDTMNSNQRLHWAYNLSTAFNKDTYFSYSTIYALSTRRIMDTYLSHIRHFVMMLDDLSQKPFISEDIIELLDRAIWYLLKHGRYFGISELIQFSRIVSEATYGEEDVRIVRSLVNHAELHRQLRKYIEAEPLYQRALAIREKAKGLEHPDTAHSLSDLALLYNDWGKYDEAEPLYKRALVIGEKVLGSEHPDTARSLNFLADLYHSLGKYDEAEPLYERALVIYERSLGSEHPETAVILNNLAILYKDQGKYGEADLLYKRALTIREKVFPEHPSTAQSLNNLASFYKALAKYDEAESLYKRALVIYEKTLGSENPPIAMSLSNLANIHFNRGKYDEAEPLYKRALMIRQKLEPQHPGTAETLNDLAKLYESQGKYDEAEPLNKQALAMCEKVLGPEHPVTAMSMGALADLFVHQRNYNDAEPLYKRALAIQEKVLNHMHPVTASLVNNLGNLYKIQGKFDDAEALYQRALNIRKEVLGSMHPATASSMSSLGDLYILQGKHNDAEPLCKLALAIREEVLGPVHPDTATSVNIMGNFYMDQGALEIRQQVLGPNHPDTATSAKNLADLYKLRGQRICICLIM